MTSFKSKHQMTRNNKSLKRAQGFTLIELILVIIILGIMAVGISGFITLSTQTYLNATNRDGLISNARFVTERLTRELRNAVPNSIRIGESSNDKMQCIEFIPIIASTVYTDIPVAPELASKVVSVIPFEKDNGTSYECDSMDGCDHLAMVYPLHHTDVYDPHDDDVGKVFAIDNVVETPNIWQINLLNTDDVHFIEDSPTHRLYIANRQVKYCVLATRIIRYNSSIGGNLTIPGGSSPSLMAEHVIADISGHLPFKYVHSTLTRNAVVQIHLNFTRNEENYVFDHEVHINNVP
ncbi:prepilin-type N-terminal cleavage/methylation domain-containing protein [Colwellia sp. 12G3]|uniref:prepilin-type N-terminal cleavage/methylation domain-containing protein n=1 Tax=Colwellia sp. 12G3 TaxID=2058299 RepID=UPI000C32AAFB|nr:prepilin-type N-terminal cleavage/methylation domain-containing protein [Colwellia sp. 12G3]PKI13151.1 hypothetical protein CXF71_20885 [Colwellia sp. 12G3]